MTNPPFDQETAQRWFAIEMNNRAWDLVEKVERTPEENEQMISAAHAARSHWSAIGKPIHALRAETLLATAYLAAGRPELSLHHAERCQAQSAQLGEEQTAFDRACLHGGLSAALLRLGRAQDSKVAYAQAAKWVEEFDHPDEKAIFEKLYPAP
jgi:hypothetical protein